MSEFIIKHAANGVWYGVFPRLEAAGIRHGISTRAGGTSKAWYRSLNLGLHTGDKAEDVKTNRALFCQALGVDYDHIVTAQQVHGDHIVNVTEGYKGRGAKSYGTAVAQTDALMTNIPGLPLMLFFADCVPVLIADPVHRAVAVSHAGWKGTVAGIGQKTVLEMQKHFGTQPSDCLVAIGPSIGPCCYEVDHTVTDLLKRRFDYWKELVGPGEDHRKLNLWAANRIQLREIGIPDKNILESGVCTSCNTELFYSHRAEKGKTGRIGAVITLTY